MSLLASMSLAGSIAMLVYFLMSRLFGKKVGLGDGEMLLKLAMALFLCPFQKVKYALPSDFAELFPGLYRVSVRDVLYLSEYMALPVSEKEYVMFPGWKVSVMVIAAAVAAVFVLYQLWRYFSLKKRLSKCSAPVESDCFYEEAQVGKRRPFRPRARRKESPAVKSPVVVGIFRPVIYLPQEGLTQRERALACRHELAHIERGDVLVKWICLAIVLLHWFNPMSYLLLREFGRISEYCCDERAVCGLSKEERSAYAAVLVRCAAAGRREDMWTSSFAGKKTEIYRRVENILEERERGKKKRRKITAAALTAAVLCSSVSVYAYKIEPHVVSEEVEPAEETLFGEGSDWMVIIPGEHSDDCYVAPTGGRYELKEMTEGDFSQSDCIFIADGTGEVFALSENRVTGDAECPHTYGSGEIRRHRPDGNGGCTVFLYEGRHCARCWAYLLEECINEIQYEKCTHG